MDARAITELERLLAKERRISAALMDRVERATDLQGNAFGLFETAITLENKVRDRTQELEAALAELAAANAALARSRTEAEEARARLADAIESSSEGFAIFDAEDRLVLCNSTYLGLWPKVADRIRPGISFREITAMVAEEGVMLGALLSPDSWVSRRLAEHAVASGSHVHALSDGRWVQINELRTTEGGIVGVYTDITEVKAEDARARARELAERSLLLQATLDSIQSGVAVYDTDRRLVAWNDPLRRLLDLPADVRGAIERHQDLAEHCRARVAGLHDCPVTRWPEAGEGEAQSWPVLADGRVLDARRRAMSNGGVVISFTDITAERRAAQVLEDRVAERTAELHEARIAAEEANRSKTRFVAAASHDLLQPLNAARLFVSALAERRLAPSNHALVRQAGAALDSVEDLLEALLEISRMDAGAITPEITDFAVADLLTAMRAQFAPFARRRGLQLHIEDSAAVVRSDPRLMRRILQNLVSNALRYTDEGEVRVRCEAIGIQMRISVEDTGPGIPAALHGAIFEEFRRLDAPGRERGMGLGLAIVRRAAAMLGHEIGLVSAPGAGSTFSVLLPLAGGTRPQTGEPAPTRRRAAAAHVLVIDNEPAILAAMEAVLTGWNCTVAAAASSAQALAAATAARPDMVLADYHLSGETGDETVAALRLALGTEVPAAIITADRTPELRERLAAQGLHVLNKPVKPAQLRALMGKLAAQPG